MSIFIIKIIACITMLLDHIKYAIPVLNNEITRYFGRVSFPLFAFLITEGYSNTKDLKKYYKRLFVFAVISQIPFMCFRTLVGDYMMLNILFTLILGLIAITIYDKCNKKYIFVPIVLVIIYLGKLLKVDYGWYGVATVVILYIFKKNKLLLSGVYIALDLAYYYNRLFIKRSVNLTMFLFTILPIGIVLLYNKKLGKKVKYFFYYFYPVHMLVLYIINKLIIN